MQALRFLDLIDEEGRQTPSFNRLGIAKEDEYPGVLADIIRSAYHDVFTIIGNNPNDATDRDLNDAFRGYQPDSQRNRIIILFRGLCQEAGLIAGGPPETRTRSRSASPNKQSPSPANGNKKAPLKLDHPYQPEEYQAPIPVTNQPLVVTGQELAILQGVLNQLPLDTGKWTQARRDKWLKAITANVDLLIDIVDPEPGDGLYTE